MSRFIFDIESDALLDKITTVWIIYFLDIDTKVLTYYLPYQGDMRWKKVMDEATLLIGHNVRGFDFPALEKVHNYKLPRSVSVHDTLIMSIVLDYMRFGHKGHSLEVWGEHLGHPKVEHEDWSQYSEEMRIRCIGDVKLNFKVYDQVLAEFFALAAKQPNIKPYMRAEHFVAEWCAQAELKGWPFDVPKATALFEEMSVEMEAARAKIQPVLGMKTVATDKAKGVVPAKTPKWTKQGCYDAHTANWFGINPWSGVDDRPIDGDYCRVEFVPLDLDSIADVKVFLFRNGWEPTEWNYKSEKDPNTGRMVMNKTSPKITEDSLEVMHGDGKLYCDFLTTKSRYGILKTWLEKVDSDGNLHGGCFTIGTPSMRARHSIIVNVPSADSTWGKEMRELFICNQGGSLSVATALATKHEALHIISITLNLLICFLTATFINITPMS